MRHSLTNRSIASSIAFQKLLSDALAGATPILSRDGNYRLNRAAGIAVDVALFEALARDGEWQSRCGEQGIATRARQRSLFLRRTRVQS